MAYRRRKQRRQAKDFKLHKGPGYTKSKDVIDFLDEDEPIPGQELCLIAYLTMGEQQQSEIIETIAKKMDSDIKLVRSIVNEWIEFEHPMRAVKVRGVWANNDRAQRQMKQKIDQYRNAKEDWHTFCAEVGKWCPFDPKPDVVDSIEGQDYYEQELNSLMKGRRLTQMKSKQYFEQRKKQMLEKAILEGTEEGQKILNEQEEPVEAVEFRIKAAEETKEELQAKMEEAEQSRIAAEKKLKHMKEQMAQGKVYPKLGEDAKEISDESLTISDDVIKRRNEISTEMNKTIRPLENSRIDPTNQTFDAKPILPHERRAEMDAETEEKLLMDRFKKMISDNPQMKEALLNDIQLDDADKNQHKDTKVI